MKTSAGLLIYRFRSDAQRQASRLEVLLVHPGGPFFKNKDDGSWTIPKGELETGEDPLLAACRETREETGWSLPGPFAALGSVTQRAGKMVVGFACEGDFDTKTLVSNTFDIEWPPRSGKRAAFPEVDRAGYFDVPSARTKINPGQLPFLDRLAAHLKLEG